MSREEQEQLLRSVAYSVAALAPDPESIPDSELDYVVSEVLKLWDENHAEG
jgi:hypothetical protein